MITLVSTAIPMVNTKPAIPGAVKVNPKALNTPMVNNRFRINAMFATHPPVLKYNNIKAKITKKEIPKDNAPPLIDSLPKVGPTVWL